MKRNLMIAVLAGLVLFSFLRAQGADLTVTIPWLGNNQTFSTNVYLYGRYLGQTNTVDVSPASGYQFKGDVTATPPSNISKSGGKVNSQLASFGFAIVGPSKEGTIHITGQIEPVPSGSGGGGGPPPQEDFDISVLHRLLSIVYTEPQNGTNLTTCCGHTNNLTTMVTLGDGTPASGTVNWNPSPTSLGSFTVNNQSLLFGSAGTRFIASSSPDVGVITTTGQNLKDLNDISLPDVSTNLTATVPKVAMVKLFEKDNPCSVVPNSKPDVTQTRLYVAVEPNSNKAELRITNSLLPKIQGIGSKVLWGVQDDSFLQMLPETGPLQDDGTADVTFTPTGNQKIYRIRVGCDENGDGVLQKEEIVDTPQTPLTTLVITATDYTTSINTLEDVRTFGALATFNFASSLLNIFLYQNSSPIAYNTLGSAVVDANDPRLTHVAGADFDSTTCTKSILNYIFANGTDPSNKVRDSNEFKQKLDEKLTALKPTVQAYFAANTNDNEEVFFFTIAATPANIIYEATSTSQDLHFALGDAMISGSGWVNVLRQGNVLSAAVVSFSGKVEDLYDFNFEATGSFPFATQAATVQIGWQPPTRLSGRIFFTEVDLNPTFSPYNFQF